MIETHLCGLFGKSWRQKEACTSPIFCNAKELILIWPQQSEDTDGVYSLNSEIKTKYSLIYIRQIYNYDMLTTIWHEIDFWKFPRISQDLVIMITKLFLFWNSYQGNNFMITTNKNWEKRGKNHTSTSNAMSNDGSSIKIIDQSHGN